MRNDNLLLTAEFAENAPSAQRKMQIKWAGEWLCELCADLARSAVKTSNRKAILEKMPENNEPCAKYNEQRIVSKFVVTHSSF